MKIIIIIALITPFLIIAIGGIIYTRPRYYLVNYSYKNGEGSVYVKRINGGELDIDNLVDYFFKDKDIKGYIIIKSFQGISKKQYTGVNNLNNRISELKKGLI